MNFSSIATTWACLEKTAKLVIVTEPERMEIARKIKADNLMHVKDITIHDITLGTGYEQEMAQMTENDLLLVLLTIDGFVYKGYNHIFSPFSKPEGDKGKYIFIRLDIPESSLLSGLNTDIHKIEMIISECRHFSKGKKVRVTTDKGTDITMRIDSQELLPYNACSAGGNAFLPPAEISEELVHTSANGVIVADITVGELRFGPELMDPLGIVDSPVTISVKDGFVIDINGGEIAQRLKDGLNQLDPRRQVLVELGHGLSDITPTGIIGVDESMNGTCHFGIGNRNPYHVDVVVADPHIEIVEG